MDDFYKVAIETATLYSETDVNGVIINVNDPFCTISGYSRDELIGQSYRILKSQQHTNAFYADIWNKVTQGSIWRGEICNTTKKDEMYWVNCTIIPTNANNKIRYISVSFEITMQMKMILNLQWQVRHDSLTGLPNRTSLLEQLIKKIASSTIGQSPFAIGMIDMDSFKAINDTYGHTSGDEVLIKIAQRLMTACRQEDTVARLGGDEFVIVWDSIPSIHSAIQYERKDNEEYPFRAILDRIFGQPFYLSNGICLKDVTGCLGVAIYPGYGFSPETLLKQADYGMYQAKEKGYGGVCILNLKDKVRHIDNTGSQIP